ncbi:MAG: addiction module antidote protein, HigA family [Candidatus Parabeggiatoa sp. nov. 3]|nr:MAG: addiction module antidote protein, HigA family [Gammaproteobacteria bacterium]
MSMYNPAHPGEILKELVIEPLGLSITEVAHHLDMSRKTLSKILKGRAAVTPEIALRLEMTFGKQKATHWLKLQNAFDLWQIRQSSSDIHVIPIELSCPPL